MHRSCVCALPVWGERCRCFIAHGRVCTARPCLHRFVPWLHVGDQSGRAAGAGPCSAFSKGRVLRKRRPRLDRDRDAHHARGGARHIRLCTRPSRAALRSRENGDFSSESPPGGPPTAPSPPKRRAGPRPGAPFPPGNMFRERRQGVDRLRGAHRARSGASHVCPRAGFARATIRTLKDATLLSSLRRNCTYGSLVTNATGII